jgi:hypothetical protein
MQKSGGEDSEDQFFILFYQFQHPSNKKEFYTFAGYEKSGILYAGLQA